MNETTNELIKRLHRAKLVPAVISIAFGIALIIARQSAMEVIVKIAAAMLIACGVGCVLVYLFGPVKDSSQFVVGGFAALIGFLAWFNSGFVVGLFPIITGIVLLMNGLSNLATLSAPGFYPNRGLIVVFSVLMIAAGIFILIRPAAFEGALMVIIGISYLVSGIFDLILLYQAKNILMS